MPDPLTACPECGNPELEIVVAQTVYTSWQRNAASEWTLTGRGEAEMSCGIEVRCGECPWKTRQGDGGTRLSTAYAELMVFLAKRGLSTDGYSLPTKEGQERLEL